MGRSHRSGGGSTTGGACVRAEWSAIFVDLTAEVLLEEVGELLGKSLWWEHVMLLPLSGEAPVVSGQLPGCGDGVKLAEFPPASGGRCHAWASSCCCGGVDWMYSVTIHCSNQTG